MNVDSRKSLNLKPLPVTGGIPHGDFKPLHLMNPLRLSGFLTIATGLLANKCWMSAVAAVF